jgi:hypothetical protein
MVNKNNYNGITMKDDEFESDWGFYVDIENIKSRLLEDKKNNINHINNKNCINNYNSNNSENSENVIIQITEEYDKKYDKKYNKNYNIDNTKNILIKVSSTTIITIALTYIIYFIL